MSEDEIIKQLKCIQSNYGFFSKQRRACFAAITILKDVKRSRTGMNGKNGNGYQPESFK